MPHLHTSRAASAVRLPPTTLDSAVSASPTDADLRRQESRLRRRLRRQGYVLCKSRTRNEQHVSFGGYLITDENRNVVAGDSDFTMNIDDVERFANDPD